MAAIRTTEEASDLVEELTDRYGDPPKAVMALLDVALLLSLIHIWYRPCRRR